MRLEVNNFRCYDGHHVVDFSAGQVTLIKGKSGAGKSTLFRAIEWCLFGRAALIKKLGDTDEETVKARKAPARKKEGAENNECWVSLRFAPEEAPHGQALWIQRKRGNGKISLRQGAQGDAGVPLEGEAAQWRIEQIFGSEALFKSSSYIGQRQRCALIDGMKKAELLQELNKLAYNSLSPSSSDPGNLLPEALKARIDAHEHALKKKIAAGEIEVARAESALKQCLRGEPIDETLGESGPDLDAAHEVLRKATLAERSAQAEQAAIEAELPRRNALLHRRAQVEKAVSDLPELPSVEELERLERVEHLLEELDALKREKAALSDPPPNPGPAPPSGPWVFRAALQRPAPTCRWTEADLFKAEKAAEEKAWLAPWGVQYTRAAVDAWIGRLDDDVRILTARERVAELRRDFDLDRWTELSQQAPGVEKRLEREHELLNLHGAEWLRWGRALKAVPVFPPDLVRKVLATRGPGRAEKPPLGFPRSCRSGVLDSLAICARHGVPPAGEAEALSDLDALTALRGEILTFDGLQAKIDGLGHVSQYAIEDLVHRREDLAADLRRIEREATFSRVVCPCCTHELRWTGATLVSYDQPEEVGLEAWTEERRRSAAEELAQMDRDLVALRQGLVVREKLERERDTLLQYDEESIAAGRALLNSETWAAHQRQREELAEANFPPGFPSFDHDPLPAEVDEAVAYCDLCALSTPLLRLLLDLDEIRQPAVVFPAAEWKALSDKVQQIKTLEDLAGQEPDIGLPAIGLLESARALCVFEAFGDVDAETVRAAQRRDAENVAAWEADRERDVVTTRAKMDFEAWEVRAAAFDRWRAQAQALESRWTLLVEQLASENENVNRDLVAYKASRALLVRSAHGARALEVEREQIDRDLLTCPSTSEVLRVQAAVATSAEQVVRAQQEVVRAERRQLYLAFVDAEKRLSQLRVDVEDCRKLKKVAEAVETNLLDKVIIDLNASLEVLAPPLFEEPVTLYVTLTKLNATQDGVRTSFDVHLIKAENDIVVSEVSGGEGDRISMCLTLALADLPLLRGSPFLLFDESLGALDADVRELCMETVRTFAQSRPNKVVAAVEHETSLGWYDTAVHVENAQIFTTHNGEVGPRFGEN